MNDVPTPHAGVSPDHASPTVVNLTAGSARITPVPADDGARYSVTLPAVPLTDDDLQDLTIALHAVNSGPAILVDVDEYAGGEHAEDDHAGTE